jgi:outer membrane scaffolding protein for murein synthesis (MipA/OmpV family)
MKTIAALLAFTALAGASGLVHAQSDFYRSVTPPNAQEGGVASAAVLVGREYQGSDESRARVLPNIEYQWSNGLFAGVLNGVGYNGSTQPDMAYGVRVTADFGRKERRSDALRGLGDVDPRPELGAFFNFSPTRGVTLNSSVRYGSGNERKGLLVDLGAGWSTSLSPHLRFGTTLATTWSNTDYAQAYFGIDAVQAARSGHARFVPGSGFRDVRLGASLIYRVAPAWSLAGSITCSELLGDARRSPIVRDKSALTAVVALGYSF